MIERLNKASNAALEANRDYLLSSGYVILGGTPAQMKQRMEHELKTVTPLLARIMGQQR